MTRGNQARPYHRAHPMRSDITLVQRRTPEGPGPQYQPNASSVEIKSGGANPSDLDNTRRFPDSISMYATATHKRFLDHAGQLAARG